MHDAAMTDPAADPIISDGHWLFPDGTRLPIIAGGDGPVDEDPIERPENLESLSMEELRALRERAVARIAGIQAQESRTVTDAREARRLTELANEVATVYAEAVAALPEVAPLAEPAVIPVPAPAAEVTPPAAAAPEAPAPAAEVPAEVPQPIAASAAGITAAELDGAPAEPSPGDGSGADIVRPTFTAAAGSGGDIAPGAPVGYEQMGALIANQQGLTRQVMQTLRNGGTVGGNDLVARVASINLRGDLDPSLVVGNHHIAAVNTAIIDATPFPTTDEERLAARTAAICGPREIRREIPNCVGHGRPVRALFRNVPSTHAAFQYVPSIGLASVAAGVTVWTDADQALVDEADPDTWKPCVPLTCADVQTADPKRIPSCLTVEVMQNLSTPEQVANWVDTIGAQTERTAEGALLDTITDLSHAYTLTTAFYGALPTLYNAVSYFLSLAADTNRQFDLSGYTLLYQSGFRRRIGLDSFSRQFSAERELERLAADLGIRLEETLDFEFTGGASPWAGSYPLNPVGDPAVVPADAPLTWRFWLLDPRAAAFFSPDEFAFGLNRGDPQLLRQNRHQWFGELFEGLLKQGCAPWFVFDIDLCMNGDRAAGSTPIPCDNGSAPVGIFAPAAVPTFADLDAIDAAKSSALEEIERFRAEALAEVNEALAALDPSRLRDAVAAVDAADAQASKSASKGK